MLGNRTALKTSQFVIPTVDDAGTPIPGVSATWELLDARGVIKTSGPVTNYTANSPQAVFTIPGEFLTADEDIQTSGYEIVVRVVGANSDETEVRDYFLVVSNTPLSVMNNSFMTHLEAIALRKEFASLPGWDSRDHEQQKAALVQAYRSLCKINFRVPGYLGGLENMDKAYFGAGTDSPFYDHGGRRAKIAMMTLEEFDGLPKSFSRAVKRAQLVEADALLGGDPIGDKRRAGLISETVGESSSFFRSTPYLNLPICKAAYDEVARYIFFQVRIQRA